MWCFYRLGRFFAARGAAEAKAEAFGSSDAPLHTSTVLMGVGLVAGVIGYGFSGAVCLLGLTLFGAGLLAAFVEAVLED